ncbi:bifunctional phosphopantothenoylcysteine decarboxylase/phosphopantothenate--cysteine ligase CoaBC [Deinococcus pimensis]|uniref:bifunctional phosphopantothenoylcysteine decarboxylase/phosphopantothenate--cysteine ligase CoaBC n=1 Tax=Deinococcus pimensis TaxID=309888 RepID=UPI00048669DE|nr:bifunctional phosphopantothenoylcysteine decarboxylase/phosphopantothenate--cysteine ligase CoaBC [Deinococcus pimensis]
MNEPLSARRPLALVIVSGSMAAVKAPMVLRRLREAGFDTRAVATRASLAFTTELSLATASDHAVFTDETWFAPRPEAQHLQLARADVVVVAAASADAIARHAAGRADDLAGATLLSTRAPVLWAPAMNPTMWEHPATARNVETLRGWGHAFVGPVFGPLGSSGEGAGFGRMAEPEEIAREAAALVGAREAPRDLAGLHVLVTAGPTREYLDPVRFISNPSSGKMGYAVAERALARGARVTLVSGPVSIPAPVGAEVVAVESALEMREATLARFEDADVVVMTAAIADYRAANPSAEKKPKSSEALTVELAPNPDFFVEMGARKGRRVLVGFAMETHAGVERAADKARRKNADFVLLNYPTREGTGFGGETNQVTLVRADGSSDAWPLMSKREVAERLLDEAARLYNYARPV